MIQFTIAILEKNMMENDYKKCLWSLVDRISRRGRGERYGYKLKPCGVGRSSSPPT